MNDVPCINSFTKHEEIAQCFGNKYKSIYNSVTESQRNMAPIYKHIQENLDCVNQEQLYVQFDTVVTAVKSLNKDKSDGDYGYFSNHLLYAGNNYLRQLTMLINAMLVHGHQPTALLMATIASVPKDSRGNMCSDANYRGIALSSSIGKVLDRLFIYKNLQNLCTSDLQFAYKKKLSTTTCTLVMKEIIKYYMDNQSNVYSCLIDATKAFDKIHHDKLFQLLIDRGVSAVDMRLLLDLYERQHIRATWKGCYSDTFTATNGIRQGSISSPILFCCYLDELIRRLTDSGIGCWMGNHYVGCLSYADDLTLMCPSATGLQKLISICEQYAKEYGMSFNPSKSVCILFCRNKKNMDCLPTIKLDGKTLSWCTSVKHLGNYISHDLSETVDIRMKRSDLVGRVNTVIGNLSGLPADIISKVFKTKCCHFYGTQIWDFNNHRSLKEFLVMWNRCVRRLLCLPHRTHCRFLPHIVGSRSPHDQICSMFLRQVKTMMLSDNDVVRYFANRHNFKNSIIGSNIEYIYRYYELPRQYSNVFDVQIKKDDCNDNDQFTIVAIKDLLFCQTIFSNAEKFLLLNYLCIN
jgi:hypothetical protein